MKRVKIRQHNLNSAFESKVNLRGITKRIPNSSLKTKFPHQGRVVKNPKKQAKDQSGFLFCLNSSAGFLGLVLFCETKRNEYCSNFFYKKVKIAFTRFMV